MAGKNKSIQNKRRGFLRSTFMGSMIFSLTAPSVLSIFNTGCTTAREGGGEVPEKDDLARIKDRIADMKKPVKWVFTGDSITQGAKHTLGYRSFPEIFSERIRFEMNRSRDIVINTAISGNATIDILNDFEWRVLQFHPDIVFIMAGTNDAASVRQISVSQYETNLHELVKKCRESGAIPVLNTPPIIQNDSSKSSLDRAALPLYVEAMRSVAEKNAVVMIDHWKNWSSNIQGSGLKDYMNDSLHPNGRGHLEIAREIFRTLDICKNDSFTCNGVLHF